MSAIEINSVQIEHAQTSNLCRTGQVLLFKNFGRFNSFLFAFHYYTAFCGNYSVN